MTGPWFMVRGWWAAAYMLALLAPAGRAYIKDYLPLGDEELGRRFPQRRIPIKFEAGATARFGNGIIRLDEDQSFSVIGKDRAGKPWRFTGGWNAFCGGFYTADLDLDGTPDLILVLCTGGNGLAPSTHVTTLMFDDQGRPVPSQMDGYFEFDGHGLKDLVDLDGDGRAELIRQAWDDGYWITSLYEARGSRWHRIAGEHAGRAFPLYTRFTTRANRIATTPTPHRHPIEDDLSDDQSTRTARLQAIQWADTRQSENPRLILDNGTVCEPVAWYSTMTVILDSPAGRTAATLAAPDEARVLLEKIRDEKLRVEVFGKRRYAVTGDHRPRRTACVPETIWASRKK
jgi:hypothetical protein